MSSPPSSHSNPQRSVSLMGCGWLGVALAHSLIERGAHVRGSTTHASRVGTLASLGLQPLLLRVEPSKDESSISFDDQVREFFSSGTLVIGLPPEAALGADYHLSQVRILLDLVKRAGTCTHLVYISSTSVYGAHQGSVDETSACSPESESGLILVEAEAILAEFARAHSFGVTIMRPGGLIGPGRHPGLFLAGRRGVANGGAPVNMIHQLDLASLMTSLILDHPADVGTTEIFNAVSDHHPSRAEFYARAAAAIGVEIPTFASNESVEDAKLVHAEKIVRVTGLVSRFSDLYSAIGAHA